MSKRRFLLLFLLTLIIAFSKTVSADIICPSPQNCNVGAECFKQCGIGLNKKENLDEYYFDSEDPTTNECTEILSFGSYGVDRKVGNLGDKVPVIRNYNDKFISYCTRNSTITATSDGEIVIHGISNGAKGYLRVKANGETFTGNLLSFPVSTGIIVSKGDIIHIIAASDANEGKWGPGWRLLVSPEIYNLANAAGDTPLVGQSWSDSLTTSIYDSYDFNDIKILPAIRKPPKCTDIYVNLITNNLNKIYLGENATLQVDVDITDIALRYEKISNIFDPVIILGGNCELNPNTENNCQVISKAISANPTKVTWTNYYKVCKGTSCSSSCSAQTNFDIFPFPGILRTQKGNVYIGKPSINNTPQAIMNQSRYKSYYEKNNLLKFSTFNFAFNTDSITDHNPSDAAILSDKQYILNKYNDSNHYESVYKRFAPRVRSSNLIKNILTYNTNTTFSDIDFQTFGDNNSQLIDIVSGSNLTINENVKCRSKTIFLVEGNLNITPNFEIEGDNACLFIVKGRADVFTNSAGIDGIIQAFIITDEFRSVSSNKKITIEGGVVARSTKFDKNVNLNVINMNDLEKDTASEDLSFEGARYIKHFGNILSNPFLLSIREKQYIK